jgi:tagaturonate epimerase
MSATLKKCLNSGELLPAMPAKDAQTLAAELAALSALDVYPMSPAATGGTVYFLGKREGKKRLAILGRASGIFGNFVGDTAQVNSDGAALTLMLADPGAAHAQALRRTLPFLNPQPLGLLRSAGCGDRLGLATPGHVRAVRRTQLAPIFAQQSIRENARTARTPQQVMDDAMWGVFQEGWREPWGADADHLKTTADIDVCAAAGFTFFTIDPGEHVDNEANSALISVLRQKIASLPWAELETNWETLRGQMGSKPVDLGTFSLTLSEEDLLRAAAKYGRVVAHTARMSRHLKRVMGARPCELEMSVDETETVTTLGEHIYIARELRRLGVDCVSLAPRYVGTFEKGVDYIGDLDEFERSFARHLAVAKAFGPYKLSLHSGSDKFRIYPIAARVAGNLVHLKTAGTSYLEALRALTQIDPDFFREIVPFAKTHYDADRASYHVSAVAAKVPDVSRWPEGKLASLLDDFDAREVLHVTFGSVMSEAGLRERLMAALRRGEEVYYGMLLAHFTRHFEPYCESAAAGGRP